MSRSLLRRKSSIKPIPVIKQSSKEHGIVFQWSVLASKFAVLDKNPSSNFQLIKLDNTHKKSFLPCISSTSPAQISHSSRLPFSTKTSSSLPPINNVNQKKELSISTNNEQKTPLLLSYSQLYRAQHPFEAKKTTESQHSISSILNNKRHDIPNTNKNVLFSLESTSPSLDEQQPTTNAYIRLRTPQLRQLHLSEKNMKEAKKLYFNPASKVFVPHSSIVPVFCEN